MKKLNFASVWTLFLAVAFTTTLSAQDWGWGIKGEGPKVKKALNVSSFDGFTLAIGGNVYLTQGNTPSVTIEAQQNIIDNIVTDVADKHWKIRFDKNVRNHDGVKIWITIPTLDKAYISGSGDIIGETKFIGLNNLVTGISGSGDIKLEIEAKAVDGKISGSGNVKLGGSANAISIGISGSGDFYADALAVQEATVSISGSGNAMVNASESLQVKVSGSGDVKYKGRPKVNAKVSGSGDVESM